MNKTKKGYVLTLDAVLALMLILVVFLFAVGAELKNSVESSMRTEFKRLHYVSEDALESMNKKGLLDVVGAQWAEAAGNKSSVYWSNASNITRDYLLSVIPPQMSFKLMIENDTIYEHNRSLPEEKASSVTRSARVLTGYYPGLPVTGFVSRAYLTSFKTERDTLLTSWQRTVSSGKQNNHLNLTTRFNLPNDFECNKIDLQAFPRMMPNNLFKMWLNNAPITVGTLDTFTEFNGTVSCSLLRRGENTMKFEVWDQKNEYEIGKGSGTRMYVDYNTSQLGYNITKRFYLDAVESSCVTKQQITLLMPGEIYSVDVHLETQGVSNVTLALVYEGRIYDLIYKTTTAGTTEFSSAEIAAAMNTARSIDYDDLEGMTYSFVVYLDTNSMSYDEPMRVQIKKTPECGQVKTRRLLPNSYIDVDFNPFPETQDLYAYNMMTVPLNFSKSGTECVYGGYYEIINTSFYVPSKALPWSVDVWTAWIQSGNTSQINQEMKANNIVIYNPPSADRYLVRFGYSYNKEVGAITTGNNTFEAVGEMQNQANPNAVINQFCFSPNLSAGVVNFLFRGFVDYGDVYRETDGCRFNFTFEDGSYIYVGNSTEPCDQDIDDATTDALKRLRENLDWNGNGRVDVKFSAGDVKTENVLQSRVRSMWGPAVFKLVVWI